MYRKDQVAEQRIALAKQAVARTEVAWGCTNTRLIAKLQSLGDLYFALGQYQEAEQVCWRLLSVATKNYVEDHSVVADALQMIGEVCEVQGIQLEAERFYLWALAVRQKTQKCESETTNILTRLAGFYRSSNQPFKAGVIDVRLVRSIKESVKIRPMAG